jgi:hypothetical protein
MLTGGGDLVFFRLDPTFALCCSSEGWKYGMGAATEGGMNENGLLIEEFECAWGGYSLDPFLECVLVGVFGPGPGAGRGGAVKGLDAAMLS